MYVKKYGVVREIAEEDFQKYKSQGYEKLEVKAEAAFVFETAKTAELLKYAESLGEEYEEIASMSGRTAANKIREAILAKQKEPEEAEQE